MTHDHPTERCAVNRIGVENHPFTPFSNKELDCYESELAGVGAPRELS